MNSAGKYFNKIASIYDQATSGKNAWTPPSVVSEKLNSILDPQKPFRLVDIGIGTGQSIDAFYKKENCELIVGLDVSDKSLEICSKNYPKAKLFNGDLLELNFDQFIPFDAVISSGAFEFIDDLKPVFHKCRKVISKNGVFLFTFELLVPEHPIQKNKKSLVVEEKSSSLFQEDFYTYRRTLSEIELWLNESKFSIESTSKFTAYQKADCQIEYCLVQALPF
jgi:ubiquinone/menaquinone biosynthesis C-methylase UbiE